MDRLNDPSIAESFQTTVGGTLAALLALVEDAEMMTINFNAVATQTANDIVGKRQQKTEPKITEEIVGICDTRRTLKKVTHTANGAAAYREIKKIIRNGMKKAKTKTKQNKKKGRDAVHTGERKNKSNSKAFQVAKDLTKQRQPKSSTIQDKQGNCLMEERDMIRDRVLLRVAQSPDQWRSQRACQSGIVD